MFTSRLAHMGCVDGNENIAGGNLANTIYYTSVFYNSVLLTELIRPHR